MSKGFTSKFKIYYSIFIIWIGLVPQLAGIDSKVVNS